MGHFWVALSHYFKGKVSARLLIWKWYFILVQIKLTHFYKTGFTLTFCKLVYKVKVFGIWIRDSCSAKAVWKKNTVCTVADIHPTTLYIQRSCKQGSILRIYIGFAVAFGSRFTGCRGLVQLAYLHSSFHHTTVECQRHPFLGGSEGICSMLALGGF